MWYNVFIKNISTVTGADWPNLSEIDGRIQSACICEVWHVMYSIKVGRRAFIMKSFYSEKTVVAYHCKQASHNRFAPSCNISKK